MKNFFLIHKNNKNEKQMILNSGFENHFPDIISNVFFLEIQPGGTGGTGTLEGWAARVSSFPVQGHVKLATKVARLKAEGKERACRSRSR